MADPAATPPGCRSARAERAMAVATRPVIAHAALRAVGEDFATSLARTLWHQVGVFLLSFLFMLALPAGAWRHGQEASFHGSGDRIPG